MARASIAEYRQRIQRTAAWYSLDDIYGMSLEELRAHRDNIRQQIAKAQTDLNESTTYRPAYAPGPTAHERNIKALISQLGIAERGYVTAITLRVIGKELR